MIDEFWRQYNQSLFAYFYHQYERDFLASCLRWISIVSYLVTAISLAGWGITQRYAVAWSVVIFSSQIANGLKDQFNITKRIWALEMYLSTSSSVLNDITKTWRSIMLRQLTEEEILKRTNHFTIQFSELEDKYIRPYCMSENSHLINKAEMKTNNEINIRHGKDDKNVENPNSPQTIRA